MRPLRLAPFAFAALSSAVACGAFSESSDTAATEDGGISPDASEAAPDANDAAVVPDAEDADADAGPTSPCAIARPANTGLAGVTINGKSTTVYCDMDTAGGGWTLVGRASPNGLQSGAFGWRSAGGVLTDPDHAYSLGVDFEFHEILWGEVPTGQYTSYAWGANVFRAQLDSAALFAATDASTTGVVALADYHVVKGTCLEADLESGTSMFHYAGFSDRTDVFFFRDQPANVTFGLEPTSWALSSSSACDHSGTLTGTAGMLFVR